MRRAAGHVQAADGGEHHDHVQDDDVAAQRRHEAARRLVLDPGHGEQHEDHGHHVEPDGLDAA